MAKNFKRSNLAVTAEADAVCALLNGGFIDLYDGTQPATADTGITTQTRLARLRYSDPAYAPATDGVAIANSVLPDNAAAADGDVTWFRARAIDGSVVCDGSVGTNAATYDLALNDAHVQQNVQVSISSLIYRAVRS